MLTLTAAAERLGVTADTLRQQIHAGRLKAEKLGPIWVISEGALATYQSENLGRVGRPFQGRPGYVDTPHVRTRLLFSPADGRGHDSIWLQYLRESFVLDLDLTNARPFRWKQEPFQDLDPETAPPGGRRMRLWNRQHLARELQVPEELIDLLMRQDATIGLPIVTFRDGPVWDGDQVDRWLSQRGIQGLLPAR